MTDEKVTPITGREPSRPRSAACDECGANLIEIELVNGQEHCFLCSACSKQSLYELITQNTGIAFLSRLLGADDSPGRILLVEVL